MPALSVVVPFYGVESYFEECLESLARQTMFDLEVVMVDDGSLDNSAVIAKAFAAKDHRFKLIQQENQGLGPARNTGVRHATGEYLAFADSDDIVARRAYEVLVGSLKRSGSDLATGNVRRFCSTGTRPSWLPAGLYAADRPATHIRREHLLLWDRAAWNKVYRRAFWDAQDRPFPEGLYEDVPVTLPAHVAAQAVDVVSDTVYYYRDRENGELSITQRKGFANLEARMACASRVAAWFREHAPDLVNAFDRSVLQSDLRMFVEALPEAEPEDRPRLLQIAHEYLAGVDPEVLRNIGVMKRFLYHLVARSMLPELEKALDFQRDEWDTADVVRGGRIRRRWYHDLPFRGDAVRAIPDEFYRADLKARGYLEKVTWRGETLVVSGRASIDRLPVGAQVEVWLHRLKKSGRLRLPVVKRDSGFEVEIDAAGLARRGGIWELRAAVTAAGVRRECTFSAAPEIPRQQPRGRWASADLWVQPVFTEAGPFQVRIRHNKATVISCGVADGRLTLGGRLERGGDSAVLVATGSGGGSLRFPISLTDLGAGSGCAFEAALPVKDFAGAAVEAPAVARYVPGAYWALSLEVDGKSHRLAVGDLPLARHGADGREVAFRRTRYGNLSVAERHCRPVVSSMQWTGEGELLMTGDCSDPRQRPGDAVFRNEATGEELKLPVSWTEAGFEVRGRPPLMSGLWALLLPDGEPFVADVDLLGEQPGPYVIGQQELTIALHRGDWLRVRVRPALSPEEVGARAQRALQRNFYPALLSEPLRDLVVFESWDGRGCSDSPRQIFEALRDRNLELVWVSRDGEFAAPEGARTVLRNSKAHYAAMSYARYVVSNSTLPRWYRKRDGQTYLQTWHGTPLKRIGFDMERVWSAEGAKYLERFAEDVSKWDVLLSPNPFSTSVMRHAFRFEGRILECGYPRNDPLLRPDTVGRAATVREWLGVPEGRKVVLYAPTWRDDAHREGRYDFDLRIDLRRARQLLAEDHVLLVRAHNNVCGLRPQNDGFVIDVTRHPDIVDLYLVADILVTDYSSAMFDFAVTGRPMAFFTYDLADYRDRLRGFYFDFEADAPGPLLHTSDELLTALRDPEPWTAQYRDRYAEFVDTFCPFDDGSATRRVVDQVFGDAGR